MGAGPAAQRIRWIGSKISASADATASHAKGAARPACGDPGDRGRQVQCAAAHTEAIGGDALAAHHLALAQRLATWPAPADAAARRYALHHALLHRAEPGAWADAWRVAARPDSPSAAASRAT